MKVRLEVNVPEQLLFELLVLYHDFNYGSGLKISKREFKRFVKEQIENFGLEHAGMGENGFSGYEKYIDDCKQFYTYYFGMVTDIIIRYSD